MIQVFESMVALGPPADWMQLDARLIDAIAVLQNEVRKEMVE